MTQWRDFRPLLLTILLFGLAWPLTKHALRDATPLWVAFGRAVLAGVVTAGGLALAGRLRLPGRDDLPSVLAVGLLQLGGFFALSHIALTLVPAGRTAVLSSVTLIFLVPLSVLLLRERISARRWAAAGIGLLGVAALVGPWAVDWSNGRVLLGNAGLLLAALIWSVAILVTRRYPARRPMMELLPWCFLIAMAMLLPLALWREPQGGIGMPAWPHLLAVGAIIAPLGTWGAIEAGRRLPPVVASLGFLMTPAVGLMVSALWLGEALGWDLAIGGLLIATGVGLAAGAKR